MDSELPIRHTVRILLINEKDQLLLMCADDPKTTSKDGICRGRFWFTIGGKIEKNEEFMDAAIRELKEETGLEGHDVIFGPKLWFGEFEMILSGRLTKIKEQFIVAHTKKSKIAFHQLTDQEKKVIKEISWFSLEDLSSLDEVVYPVVLKDHLPDILRKNYPEEPIWIDLEKSPENKG